jgi:hypothetical protein
VRGDGVGDAFGVGLSLVSLAMLVEDGGQSRCDGELAMVMLMVDERW